MFSIEAMQNNTIIYFYFIIKNAAIAKFADTISLRTGNNLIPNHASIYLNP